MSSTLHSLVLVQMAGWLCVGLLMLQAGWDPIPEERSPAWPWGHVAISFFWIPLLVLALIVMAASFAMEQWEDHRRRNRP